MIKREIEMCCGTTCDKKLNAWYVAKLERERDELAAHVSALTDCFESLIESSHGVYGLHMNGDIAHWGDLTEGGRFEEWLLPLSESPTFSLAEIKARAVEEAAVECQMAAVLTGLASGMCRNSDLYEYANRIRKEAE